MGEAEIVGIRLHGEGATKAAHLNALLGELGALDAQPEREKGDFYPLALPSAEDYKEEELTAAREEIRRKILTLFANLLKTFRAGDKTPMMSEGFQVNLGEASQHFDAEDLASVLGDISRLMDPTDPDFNSAVADRVTGVINILGAAAETAWRYLDQRGVFTYLRRMSDDVTVGGVRKKITEIPWEADEDEAAPVDQPSRKRILDARLRSMLAARFAYRKWKIIRRTLRTITWQ